MKVWIKYLLGIALGIVASFLLPFDNIKVKEAFVFLTDLFIRIGRYIVVPLIFSTAICAINKLRSSKMLLKISGWTFAVIILSTLLLTILGLVSILIVKLPRIPITVDVPSEITQINIKQMILSLFPSSGFQAVNEGSFLLVCLVMAFIIGWESSANEILFKPVFALADSCSKLFSDIAVFFTEIMSVFCVAIMAYWFVQFREIIEPGIYTPMILMFVCDFVIIAGIFYPLILRFLCHDPHPYRVLFASIAPSVLAFISGDSNLIIPLNMRHGGESLGIRRRCRGFTYPLFSIFARGGSALVTTISFVLIWRSYSSLSLPVSDILWIFGISFGLSFLLGGFPSGGAFILLTILCTQYAKGFETSFLLLQPASLIICSFASLFDAITAMFGSYIVAVKTKLIEHHSITHFI